MARARDERDEEDDFDAPEGADDDDGADRVSVERLADVGDWELYRLVDEDGYDVICTVSLHPAEHGTSVEYGIWRTGKDTDDPGAVDTMTWESDDAEWGDPAREDVLRQIVYRYEEDLKVAQDRLAFHLSEPPDEEEDDDEGDEDDEDEEEDDDEDEA